MVSTIPRLLLRDPVPDRQISQRLHLQKVCKSELMKQTRAGRRSMPHIYRVDAAQWHLISGRQFVVVLALSS